MTEKRIVLKAFGVDVDAGPMTEIESELDDLEASWSDFAYAIRPGSLGRVLRRPGKQEVRMQPLGAVHSVLEHYREKEVAGDRAALFDALVHCAAENVPMPYWVGAAILDIARELHLPPIAGSSPKTLHELFGMEARFPVSATKAIKAKRDLHLRQKLWSSVHAIMRTEKLSKDAAIGKAREQLRFPYSQRKARDLFDLQEEIQRGYLDAQSGKKRGRTVHRIR